MRFILSVLIVLFGLTLFENAQAQNEDKANSGSFYSGFGFGSPADAYSPHTMGMGLTGISVYSGFSPNSANPAQWGLSGYTQGALSVSFLNHHARDRFDSSQRSLFAFENFHAVFPVVRNRMGVSFKFTPVTQSNFQRLTEGSFQPVDNFDDLEEVEYAARTQGSGGVNRFEAGFGYRLFNNVSFGYSTGIYLLSQNQEVTSVFSDQNYRPVTYNRDIEGYAVGHRFGLFASTGNVFGSDDQFSLGASMTLPVTIDADRSVTSFRTIDGQRTLIRLDQDEASSGTVKLPLEINAGLTYNFNRYVDVTTEILLQNWGDAEYSYNPTQEAFYKDRMRAGFGLQYHPYRAEQRGGFFSNFRYSLGSSYDTGHLNINGEDINTLFLNAGIGLISRQSASSIDLSFHYGIRGTETAELVKENIWGFKLSLNLAEIMFVRQRFQ